jgi:uroporphyrinogen-III synthase
LPQNSAKPLTGRRILITRARHQASHLAVALQELGAETILIPAIAISPPDSFAAIDRALQQLQRYQWIVFTSANAVAPFVERLQQAGLSAADTAHARIAAVGPATAKALEQAGFSVALLPESYVAESLAAALRPLVPGCRVLLVRALAARDVIPEELALAGAEVTIADAYQNSIPLESIEEIRQRFHNAALQPDAVTFTSSSTARNFFALLEAAGLASLPKGTVVASIGPVTSATLRELEQEPHLEASKSTIPGLVAVLETYFRSR